MLDLYNRYKRFELGLVSRWMFRNRRWEQAAELFSQLIDIDPDSPQSYRRLGDAYFRLGRWEDAEASYHSAVRLDSNDPLTFLHLGEVLAQQDRCEEAVEAFRRSISLHAGNWRSHQQLGDALCRVGLFADAATAYEQALGLSPDNALSWQNLGNALAKLGRWEQAEAACRSAIRLDSALALPFLHLGEALANRDRPEDAVDAFRRSISLDAGNSWSHHHLGDALCKLGHFEQAVTAYQQALVLSPENRSSLQNLGNTLSRLERWEEAARAYEKCMSTDVDDAQICINLGNALSKLEHWHESESAYIRARAVAGDDPQITEALASVWLKLERWEEAAAAYEQCVAVRPEDIELQRNLGIAVFKFEAHRAYARVHPGRIARTQSEEDDTFTLPEPAWTADRFGSRVIEIERWIEGLIPTSSHSSIEPVACGERTVENARLLFILDNDFGELTTVMYLLLGQASADHIVLLMPESLYQTNNLALPGRTFCFHSIEDVERVVNAFQPDIVFLCSGYLYAMHDLFSHEVLASLIDFLGERGCKVVTADPFLGVLSRQPVSSLISVDLPDADDLALPAHVFKHLAYVKAEQDERIIEKLSGAEQILRQLLHLYPAHANPEADKTSATDAREVAFFNPSLICNVVLQPDAGTTPHWIFILSATDLETQLMFEAVRGFTDIVARLLKQAIELGRRPIFVGPQKFIRDLAQEMRGSEGAELLTFCSFTRIASLLLTAEYAFYWNSVSHSILLRSFNGLPVILLDRGHLVRNVEAIYERVVQWYYQGVQPIYMDHNKTLTLEGLEAATADFKRAAERMVRDFQRADEPKYMIQRILGAT